MSRSPETGAGPHTMGGMARSLGFPTYVFIERHSANAAVLHPFPEHDVELVRDALADAGFEMAVLGSGEPVRGEGVYFEDAPFGDEVLGRLADALTLRGIGAYAYALLEDSLGPGAGSISLFSRVGSSFPRYGRRIVLTHIWVGEVEGRTRATTWFFGAPADLEEVDILLSSRFDTEPVHDLDGMAAIEIRHEEVDSGLTTPVRLMDEIFAILGASGFEGPAFCFDQTAR